MSRIHIAASAIAATTLVLAGCGSSKPTGTNAALSRTAAMAGTQTPASNVSSGRPLSRAELVAKTNAICGRLRAQGTATVIRSRTEYAPKLEMVASHYRAAAAELAKLTPPASMANEMQQLISDHQTIAIDTAKLIPYEETRNQVQAVRLIHEERATQSQIISIATHNGYTECGRTIG